jgi:hypothetical protein
MALTISFVQQNCTYPEAGYPDRLGPSGKFVEISTKISCLQITGYRIKYSTVLCLLELQIRRSRKVQTQVHTVNSNSEFQTDNLAYFQEGIQFSRFSAYPDGSPSQLILLSGVVL